MRAPRAQWNILRKRFLEIMRDRQDVFSPNTLRQKACATFQNLGLQCRLVGHGKQLQTSCTSSSREQCPKKGKRIGKDHQPLAVIAKGKRIGRKDHQPLTVISKTPKSQHEVVGMPLKRAVLKPMGVPNAHTPVDRGSIAQAQLSQCAANSGCCGRLATEVPVPMASSSTPATGGNCQVGQIWTKHVAPPKRSPGAFEKLPPQLECPEIEVESFLGSGTFGDVFRVRLCGRAIAVKVVAKDPTKPLERQHVFKELEMLAMLGDSAKCVISCVGFHLTTFNLQIFLELYDMDLQSRIRADPKLTEASAKNICRCLLTGLAHLHAHRVVHRDLKPGNILLKSVSDAVVAVIADLGAARLGTGSTDKVTTLSHQPPEIELGMGFSFVSDIWSLGLTFLEMADRWFFTGLLEQLHKPKPMLCFLQAMVAKLSPDAGRPLKCLDHVLFEIEVTVDLPGALGHCFPSSPIQTLLVSMVQFNPARRHLAAHLLSNSRW